jgi:hypothetical protein
MIFSSSGANCSMRGVRLSDMANLPSTMSAADPNPAYSLRCRVASEPVRWRDQGTSQRGVYGPVGMITVARSSLGGLTPDGPLRKPIVFDARVATSCHQMGAGEPI